MQSASDTPSSYLLEWCAAGIELAGMWAQRHAGRANRGPKAVAERSHFGDLDVPKCITSTAKLRLFSPESVKLMG
jgi:hypothetical protein